MSHTLIYYKPSTRSEPSPARIQEVLATLPHSIRTGDEGDFHYTFANQATGVEFSLEYRDSRGRDLEDEDGYAFFQRDPVGLVARIDYLRPSFFGLEAMPWLAYVASELDLEILDPQHEDGSAAGPACYTVKQLFESWDRSNTRATRTLLSQEGIEMARAPRAVLEAWWRYQMAVPELREQYAGGPAVPAPSLMQDARGRVTSLVIWNFPEPVVLPATVETVFVNRERRRYRFFRVEEAGSVRTGTLLGVLGSSLDHHDEPVPHVVFDPGRLAAPQLEAAERLSLDTRIHYHTVNPTRLTDVEPEA